jgi:ATP-binding cassette subfamily F protein 3
MALNEFEGTVMLVSHDRALLRSVCDEFWLVAGGTLRPYDGDLDDYQRYLLEEARRQREQAKNQAAHPMASTGQQRKQAKLAQQQQLAALRPLKKELQQIEERLTKAQSEERRLQELMATSTAATVLAENGKLLKTLTQDIERLEERWLDLSEQIEKASATTVAAD